jgi:rRNA-processing protein FCF1
VTRDPLSPPVCLAIDTNLLLVLLGYRCLLFQGAKPIERGRVLTEIRGRDDNVSPERFDDLWDLFRNAARRIVTQHVVAETYGSRRKLGSFQHQKDLVWRSARALLMDHPGIEEQACTIRDVLERKEYRNILEELGPTDAGLILTAERQKATIITDDGRLAHLARARSVQAMGLHEI